MIKNLTEGNPLKLILQFSIPLILGNLFQQTYNMVDTAIVGKTLGANALGSVGASSSIQFLVLGFCMGISLGFGIPIAREFGAGNLSKMRSYIFNGIILCAIIAISTTVLCVFFCDDILKLLQTPDILFSDANSYLSIIFIGISCNILYNFTSSILRAVGNSKTPFYFLVFSSILNVLLDFYCILVLHWGVAGAAIATVFSQGLSGILCIILIKKKYEILQLQTENKHLDKELCINLLAMGLPMGFQFSITAIGSMFIQSSNNALGAIYTSGFAAATKIKQFFLNMLDSLAVGISTYVSQNLGAKKFDRIIIGLKQGTCVGIILAIIIGIILNLFGIQLSCLFLPPDDEQVLLISYQFLRTIGWFFFVLATLMIVRMSLQGLGFAKRAVITGFLEMLARMIISIFFVPIFGYTAVCFADPIPWIIGAIYVLIMFKICFDKVSSSSKSSII